MAETYLGARSTEDVGGVHVETESLGELSLVVSDEADGCTDK